MASVEALVERAERCMDTFELPLALKFYERALKLEPNNTALLDAAGELLMRLGERERAVAALEKSVSLAPGGNFATYLNLAQLQSGAVAVQTFEKGIGLLRARERGLRKASKGKGSAGTEAREELNAVEQHICGALCAIAEVRARSALGPLCSCPPCESCSTRVRIADAWCSRLPSLAGRAIGLSD